MPACTQFHVWAGSARVSLDAVNDLYTTLEEAQKAYAEVAKHNAYAELVLRDWNTDAWYVGRRWVGDGCRTGCCGWTLNTLASKGDDAGNYRDHKDPGGVPGAVQLPRPPV